MVLSSWRNSELLGKESPLETEKTVEEILADASKVDGTDLRLYYLNCLNALKVRLSVWLSVLHARKEGPSFMEMDLIVKDIENKLESIKKVLERHQVRAQHHRKALGFPLRVGVGLRVIKATSAAVEPVVTRSAQRSAV